MNAKDYNVELDHFVGDIAAAASKIEALVKNAATPEDRQALVIAFDGRYPEIQEKLSRCVGFISAINDMESSA